MRSQTKNELALELQRVIGQLRRAGFSKHKQHHFRSSLRDSERMMLFMVSKINDGKPVTTSELAHKLGVTLAAVTHRINALEEAGLVLRSAHETDRRIFYISISNKGQKLIDEMEAEVNDRISKLAHYLGSDDTKTLIRIIKKLSDFPGFLKDKEKDA